MRRALLAVVVLLAAACSSGAATSTPAVTPSATAPSQPRVLNGTIGLAAYSVEVPVAWNGTLFLYSHGYVAPGSSNPAVAAPGPAVSSWLLDHGYAIAGSSYSSTGWALADAFKDQVALLDLFSQRVSAPKRVIAWGHSLGGIITAGLVQLYPDRFAGAIPMCGVVGGGVGAWNTGLDGAYAFKTLLAPQSTLQLVHITDPNANAQQAIQLFNQAGTTPGGQARIALVGALSDVPGWFDTTRPAPAPTDFAAWAVAQAQWESRVDFAFEFGYRAELEKRAGGNPSWNTGVDYHHQLSISPDLAEVTALYKGAGLDLEADLSALDSGPRIKADPGAVAYLDANVSFDGNLSVPVVTMHTIADGLVIPQNETSYADVVRAAGKQDLLRQVYVQRAGHCAFTSAEMIALAQAMIERLDTGRWDDAALQPAALKAAAQSLGAAYNSFGLIGFAATPAFAAFDPGPYPRPFTKGSVPPA